MADTDENKEANPINQNDRLTPTRTSSSEDPDQDTPTTSTECEEVPSAELPPADNSIKQSDKVQQLDISLKNLETEGNKKGNDTKKENKDENTEIKIGKDDHQSEDEDSDDDEEAVLESSPCGRWHKRKEQV